jgi:hypothetical protein
MMFGVEPVGIDECRKGHSYEYLHRTSMCQLFVMADGQSSYPLGYFYRRGEDVRAQGLGGMPESFGDDRAICGLGKTPSSALKVRDSAVMTEDSQSSE